MLDALPPASALIADHGYDSNWSPSCPESQGHGSLQTAHQKPKAVVSLRHKGLYRSRHKIQNLFAKLKDWRRIATRHDRCAHTFFSIICVSAAVAF